MIGRFLERHHLRRVSLRVQLTVLYTGLIGAFVIVVLGVAGLLIRTSSTSVTARSERHSADQRAPVQRSPLRRRSSPRCARRRLRRGGGGVVGRGAFLAALA